MSVQIGDTAPDFEAKPPKAGSISMTGPGIPGRCCSPTKGLHPHLHHRAGLHGEDQARVSDAERQGDWPAGRLGRRTHGLGEGHRGDARVRRELPDHFRRRLPRRQALRQLPAETSGPCSGRTPADNHTVRNVFVIGPDKKVKLVLVDPMTTGRNFDEVLRVIDSLQLTAKHKVATPVNWQLGEDVIIAGSVSDEEAWQRYAEGWRSPKPYIRIVPQPH